MKTPIDLTKLNGEGPMPISMESGPRGPSIHIRTKGYELEFPDEGEMKVRFKMRRKEEMPQTEEYECCLELVEILSVKSSDPEAPAKSGTEAGDALDALREEMMGEEEGEEEEED